MIDQKLFIEMENKISLLLLYVKYIFSSLSLIHKYKYINKVLSA